MQLQLQTRQLGEVFVIQCNGRLIAGEEALRLQSEVKKCLEEPFGIVLNLSGLTFLDSSGLGSLVRHQAGARAAGRRLCLCCLPEIVRKTLSLTNVLPLFETFETELEAVRAAHGGASSGEANAEGSLPQVLCIDESAEVRAYLGALLRRAGYRPLITLCLHDALILQKAVRAKTIIVSQELSAGDPAVRESLMQIEPAARIIQLEAGFSTQDAAQAGEKLLESLRVGRIQDSKR